MLLKQEISSSGKYASRIIEMQKKKRASKKMKKVFFCRRGVSILTRNKDLGFRGAFKKDRGGFEPEKRWFYRRGGWFRAGDVFSKRKGGWF